MLTIRAFSLVLLLSFPFGFGVSNFTGDEGCGIDPNGCSGRHLATQAGGEMDPNGGSAQSDYSACLDPNGGCRER